MPSPAPENPDPAKPKAPRDPLESLLRKGDMLDLELAGEFEPGVAPVGDDIGATVTTRGIISTGALRSISDDEVTRHVSAKTEASHGTTMDGGKQATNLSLEGSRRYRLRKELGSGGMATVYDAVDLDLRRHVALKVLHDEHRRRAETTGESEDRSALQRFVEEAQITGQLEHPNIVPVHEIGRDQDGRMYFAMKRVEGSSLAEIIERMRAGDRSTLNRYGLFELCEIVVKVCDAIAFAHSRHVIHRDLKPDNIMVGRFGEVQVMDWGLAKVIGGPAKSGISSSTSTFTGIVSTDAGDAQATIEGTISGTPAYMAPEQARGEIARIDERSDVFMLGGILYELITLVPPYHAESSLSALRRAQSHDLQDPKRAVEELTQTRRLPDGTRVDDAAVQRARKHPPELASIAMKALSESPADRYQTPRDMAQDIERYLKREEVLAHHYPLLRRAEKLIQRNRVKAGASAIVVTIVLLAALTILLIQKMDADEKQRLLAELYGLERDNAEQQAQEIARQRLEEERLRQQTDTLNRRARAMGHLNLAADLIKRVADVRDPDVALAARRTAITHLDRALAADPAFAEGHQWRAEVRIDIGHLEGALADIEAARRLWLADKSTPSPGTLMAGAMILLTSGSLRWESDLVWQPRFLEYTAMVRDAASSASSSSDRDYAELGDVLHQAITNLSRSSMDASGLEVMRTLGARLRTLIHVSQSKWEVFLFASWFSQSGWLESDPAYPDSMAYSLSLIERAMNLRPNLPLAIMFKNEVELGQLRSRHAGARPGATVADRQEFAREATAIILPPWNQHLERYPHDPIGLLARATLPSRLRIPISEPTVESRISDLRQAIRLVDRKQPYHAALGTVLLSQGRLSEAVVEFQVAYDTCVARGDFVTGNWSPSAPGFCPTIGYVATLVRAQRFEDARAALVTIREMSSGDRRLYSQHYQAVLHELRRYGQPATVVEFIQSIEPVKPDEQDLTLAASVLLRMGAFDAANAAMKRVHAMVEERGSTLPTRLRELQEEYQEQVNFLEAGSPRLTTLRARERERPAVGGASDTGLAFDPGRRWMAVLRSPADATVWELRRAILYVCLNEGDGEPDLETVNLVRNAMTEMRGLDPGLADRLLNDEPRLRQLLEPGEG